MANTFLAAKGIQMGGSLVDQDSIEIAKKILGGGARARVELPTDLVVADSLDSPGKIEIVEVSRGLSAGQKAFDIGPKTIERYAAELKKAKTIFWNGPMGVFETGVERNSGDSPRGGRRGSDQHRRWRRIG
jgi:phosphoglycerate kinase